MIQIIELDLSFHLVWILPTVKYIGNIDPVTFDAIDNLVVTFN